jgi:hypothetical protein
MCISLAPDACWIITLLRICCCSHDHTMQQTAWQRHVRNVSSSSSSSSSTCARVVWWWGGVG